MHAKYLCTLGVIVRHCLAIGLLTSNAIVAFSGECAAKLVHAWSVATLLSSAH